MATQDRRINTSKYTGIGSLDPASETGMGLMDYAGDLGFGLGARLDRLNTPSSTVTTPTQYGTRQQYTPGVSFTSNDPLKGTVLESGAFLGLDPLGIFDVPQIQADIERLDPNALADIVSKQARRSAIEGMQLEEELEPEVAAARRGAMENLLKDIEGGMTSAEFEAQMRSLLGDELAMPGLESSPLLEQARANAMRDLELGYSVSPEIQNLIGRTTAESASGGGFLGGVIGRDLYARDLGLTGMDLYNQRMGTAQNLGMQQEQTNLTQQGLKANINNLNRQFAFQATQAIQDQKNRDFQNRFGAAQFTQGIERPVASLDPGALASFVVADVNQRNELINAANVAQLNAASGAKSSQLGLMGDVATGIMGAFCWVAREAYDQDESKWTVFRLWLLSHAPEWLFKLYCKHGERFAQWISNKPLIKLAIRKLMDRPVEVMYGY